MGIKSKLSPRAAFSTLGWPVLCLLVGSLMGFLPVKPKPHAAHVNRITSQFKREMLREHGLKYFGGGGAMLGKVEGIFLNFITSKKASIDEARKLETACVERLLEMINEDEEIRPYLSCFPFTNEGILLSINFFEEGDKNYPPEESISGVRNAKGNILYTIRCNETKVSETIFTEPYLEALEKVRAENGD